MRLPHPLVPGRLVRRYKRFLADVALDSGETVTAHCANPGSMLGLSDPGLPVWLSASANPKRRLGYSWELTEIDGQLVGINTSSPNRIAEEAVRAGLVPELQGYDTVRREVHYGASSRVDMLLERGPERCYVEVKNVHLSRARGLAEFPDSVTARGAKHLRELAGCVRAGDRAVMLFVVQRSGCARFSLAGDIDPAYMEAFGAAVAAGVEALCYSCHLTHTDIRLAGPVEFVHRAAGRRRRNARARRAATRGS